MNKILLVYEEYSELMHVEAALKKIGFDVIGITHEYSIMEQVVSFNPDVVVGCGKGGKVSSLGVGRRLKEMSRWSGKTILIFNSNNKPAGPDLIKIRSDIMLEAPVPPLRLIQVLAKLLGHDEAVLQERLNKMIHGESTGAQSTGATPTFSTAKGPSKNENVKFVVGGGSPTGSDKTLVGGMNFNRASEKDEGEGEEKPSTVFAQLKGRQDLYQSEAKNETGTNESLFAEVDLKTLERELSGTAETQAKDVPQTSPAAAEPVEASPSKAPVANPDAESMASAVGSTEEKSAATPQTAASSSAPQGAENASVISAKSIAEDEKRKLMEELAAGGSDVELVTGSVDGPASTTALSGESSSSPSTSVTGGSESAAPPAGKEKFWEGDPSTAAAVAHQQEELAKAQASVHDRVARYSEYLKAAPGAAQGGATQLTRTEARKRQRELVKDWDAEKLKDLDKLRREFTKALYKK